MRLTLLTALILFVFATSADAQFSMDDPYPEGHIPRVEIGAALDLAIPLSKFAQNSNTVGFGGGGNLLYKVQQDGPIWAGVEARGHRFDNERVTYVDDFGGQLIEYREVTASRAVLAHAVFRFQPLEGCFSPYLQAGLGWHWFFTNTKITDVELEEVVDRFNEQRDSGLGYTLQAGVQYTPAAFNYFSVDLRASYYNNASVSYMAIDPAIDPGPGYFPVERFDVYDSVIDILSISLGVAIRF